MREHIQLAAKLYECNKTAKKFFKEEYPAKIAWYIKLIKAVCEQRKMEVLEAVIDISKNETFQENGMALILLMAAAVDIIEEPKKAK